MRLLILIPARAIVLFAVLVAQPGAAQTPQHPDQYELRELENALSEALLDRDVKTLDRLWHPDLIFIRPNGVQSTKAERLAGQRTAPPRQNGETNVNGKVDIRIEGNTAIVTVVSTWTTPKGASVSAARYRALHVWLRDAQSWRLVAAQVASIAE